MKKSVNISWWALTLTLTIVLAFLITFAPQKQIQLGPTDGSTSTQSFVGDRLSKPVTINLEVDYDQNPQTPFIDIIMAIPQGFDVIYEGSSIPRPDLEEYFPNTNPIQFTRFTPLVDETLSYVLVPKPTEFCPMPPGYSVDIESLYLAPPEETRVPLGTTNLEFSEPTVIRTAKSGVKTESETTIYLHVYPGCASSYTVSEAIPTGWTITDYGGGFGGPNSVTWQIVCQNTCDSAVLSYKVQAPELPGGPDIFNGQYQIPAGSEIKIIPSTQIPVIEIDCTLPGNCGQAACLGEHCNAQQTQTCFDSSCVDSCTGRAGYECLPSDCNPGDIEFSQGRAQCERDLGSGAVCCQNIPQQTCKEAGGYCTLDETAQQTCPPGMGHATQYDLTCNDYEIPLEDQYPICCILSGAPGGGGGGSTGGGEIEEQPEITPHGSPGGGFTT